MRVLLAEDDSMLGDGLQVGLRQLGFQVDWVRDGLAAERELRSGDYAGVHGLVADPVNATVLVAFLLGMFWHARLGLQVIVEDYVHTPLSATLAQLAILFVCALAAIAGVLAVLRIALGS